MHLFLMRHGSAEPSAGSDADRTLTDRGCTEVQAVAAALEKAGYRPGIIVHSPLVRARQSAELLSAWFGGLRCLERREVIEGGQELLNVLGSLDLEDPLVVGHEPGIPRLATKICGLEQRLLFHCAGLAAFQTASLPPAEPCRLLFFLDPNLLGSAT